MKEYRVALIVGHFSEGRGAKSIHPSIPSEWDLNNHVADEILVQDTLTAPFDITYSKFTYPNIRGYGNRVRYLADTVINTRQFDLVLEVHYNASVPSANGVEALHYPTNFESKRFCDIFNQTFEGMFGLRNRGSKTPSHEYNRNRGLTFLQEMSANAVICEPFFGSNLQDIEKVFGRDFDFESGVKKMAGAYRLACHQYFAMEYVKNVTK